MRSDENSKKCAPALVSVIIAVTISIDHVHGRFTCDSVDFQNEASDHVSDRDSEP